jgi:hypothetical protein
MALLPEIQACVCGENRVNLDKGNPDYILASFSSFDQLVWYVKKYHAGVREIPVRANGHLKVMLWLDKCPVFNGIKFYEKSSLPHPPMDDEPEGAFMDMPPVEELVGENPLL